MGQPSSILPQTSSQALVHPASAPTCVVHPSLKKGLSEPERALGSLGTEEETEVQEEKGGIRSLTIGFICCQGGPLSSGVISGT